MNLSWIKHDITLPKPLPKELSRLTLLIVLPNILFWALAYWTDTARPIINVDYLLSAVLLLVPYRLSRILGVLVLMVAMLFDALMFTVQIFPFMDLAAIRYLLPFLTLAPTRYLLLLAALLFGIAVVALLMLKLSRYKSSACSFMVLAVLAILSYLSSDFKYHEYNGGMLGRTNYYLGHSQTYLFGDLNNNSFSSAVNTLPELSPYPKNKQRAATHLRADGDKILYIIAESWGVPRTDAAKQVMLQRITSQKNNLEFIEDGFFDFAGATVQGEMRELCDTAVANGYALSRINENRFKNCLPNQFAARGYHTAALHGTSGRLYDRYNWWKKAGFQQVTFGENLMNLRRCTAFKGVCDSELTGVIADTFKKNADGQLFFYWLTLTSHAPYPEQDIHNTRFDCTQFGMKPDGDICRNAQLETQFLDDLAALVARPEMQGVEVMVVGDHMPPLFGNEPIQPFLRWQDVSWLHFKVKSKQTDGML